LIEQVQIQQPRNINRLFEIGSKRAYFVPGRLMPSVNLGRTLFFGPSLMRMLYAVAPYGTGDAGIGYGEAFKVNNQSVSPPEDYARLFGEPGCRQVFSAPGFGKPPGQTEGDNRDFFINLTSEMFNIPFGLCIILKDPKNNPYGAMYLEDVYIESHAMTVQSSSLVMGESVNAQFSQVAPVQLVTKCG